MMEQLLDEFKENYQMNCTPDLPAPLQGYRFISCLQDHPQRKVWLLQTPSGLKQVLCKYAAGEYVSMLRTEKNFSNYEKNYGKFSFIPYIIDYFETENGEAYLLREYIEGQTLQEWVEKKGPMTTDQALPVIRQLCHYLSHMHHMNPPIIYRDLKPANVVITPSEECYLIDVGTVRLFHAGNRQDTEFLGSADTAAPEQYGARQTDERTDIYALGKLYCYLLTGELNAYGTSGSALPQTEAKAIQKATSFDPDRRYSSVEEFLDALSPPKAFPGKKRCLAVITALTIALVCALSLLITPFLHLYPRKVTFDSPLMQRAVTSALGKSEGEPVYYNELARIQSLLICGTEIFDDYDNHYADSFRHSVTGTSGESVESVGNIQDISLLSYMTNLNELVLDHQGIRDLTPLEGLPLSRVSLCGNPFYDLSPLEDCDTLRVLSIADTNVSDLTPIASCDGINELHISQTKVTEIAPLCQTPITILSIEAITLTDYSRLKEMPINCLICRNLSGDVFEPVSQIPTLNHIVLYESDITSLNEVAMFHQVSTLDVCSNQITSLEGIESFPNLSCLCMLDNPLTDISDVGKSSGLLELQLGRDRIKDFSPLREAEHLQILSNLSEYQKEEFYEVIPDPWFSVN